MNSEARFQNLVEVEALRLKAGNVVTTDQGIIKNSQMYKYVGVALINATGNDKQDFLR